MGEARRTGAAMADNAVLDGDVILCAQVRSLDLTQADYVVATTNPTRFVHAQEWHDITP